MFKLAIEIHCNIMQADHRIKYLRASDDFPPLSDCRTDGLLAAGGDLSPGRLVKAYSSGIFPWYDISTPIMWYSPETRCLLKPGLFRTSSSLKQKLKNGHFTFSFDKDFASVIQFCAGVKRKQESGTWITPAMIDAYTELHKTGLAHSVEVWHEDRLAGGLYGVSLGKAFFGESMFHLVSDASKAALYYLCTKLDEKGFHFIDAQMPTSHLLSLGAFTVSRDEYISLLKSALEAAPIRGSWNQF
ncbi:leucyl/phenylalanyl-tRNA--protein transferase [Lentimicrobium sp.]|mgnify:CR=1 FL=1|jgi:leucyl/phenylalanyl-tRNA--protein transferase|uniref:leucyl/phenylalanyl-tRNA--protein transferase n=1 Tax=Lentimicrobium sp. TaxID=2034841 RepID=UPI002CB901C7|nr:leucyl/phenylalanyl-tRNA--protein transferase [Lentimicrobium sp.]HPF64502.1 leucyl/phenylalanyl-tRNA--protein transferase [Lentimicrobium sp.]HRW69408.1 leucyl/phenylalanyl-tRNA--protein transferase [Lentimicrobium sp.]